MPSLEERIKAKLARFKKWAEGERKETQERIEAKRKETEREIEELRAKHGESDAVSQKGLNFIADHEGVILKAYNDPVGHCTVGVGHLLHLGNCTQADISRWAGLTEKQALDLLKKDVKVYAAAVLRLIDPKLSQHELDALTSFTFNMGVGALEDSSLRRRLNAGENRKLVYEQELPRWNKAGNPPRPWPGLTIRRADEVKLAVEGKYS
jgi:lysozyme